MTKSNFLKISLTVLGILMLMAACTGGSTAEESAQVFEPTPTLVFVGSSVEKPVPFGFDIMLKNLVISVNEINRSADDLISQTNGETPAPAPADGQEYLLVRITNQCIATESPTCFVSQSDFQLMDAAVNSVSPLSDTSGSDGFYTYKEFPQGTSNRGFLTFLVEEGVEYPILTYNSFYKGYIYMSLSY